MMFTSELIPIWGKLLASAARHPKMHHKIPAWLIAVDAAQQACKFQCFLGLCCQAIPEHTVNQQLRPDAVWEARHREKEGGEGNRLLVRWLHKAG